MMQTRKDFLKQAALMSGGTLLMGTTTSGAGSGHQNQHQTQTDTDNKSKWPDGSRLVISVSMQFEAGGEPETGFDSPFPSNLEKGFTDLPAKTWFHYGYKEGIPRLLDLWDKHNVKVTSHTIAEAARKNPELAREIVKRGHEISGHGLNWTPQYTMDYDQEKNFIRASIDVIKEVTGVTTLGYNCNWLRRSPNTIRILRELGFLYHIDDLSRDEPFLIPVEGQHFAVVPYTLRCNDIMLLEGRSFTSAQFLETLKLEFDQLYKEGATRKRMMSVSTHDRISGTPAQVNAIDQFLTYAKQHAGIKFMRKDEIARIAINDKNTIVDPDFR